MASRGRPAKILTTTDLVELEKFLIGLNFLKKNQQKAIQLLQKEYDEFNEKDLNLLKIVHREKIQFEKRQSLISQIQLKQQNQQPLLANEIEILQLLEKEQDQDTFFRLDRALESYQKIHRAVLNDRIRLENEQKREVLNKSRKTLTEAQIKRNEENRRKYELGGAVLAAFKKMNFDIHSETPDQITSLIVNNTQFASSVRQSKIFKEMRELFLSSRQRQNLFLDVLEGLSTWESNNKKLSTIEIEKHQHKHQ
jgi:hypothetical protein